MYTVNNYTEQHRLNLLKIECKYHVVGEEIGRKTKTPHLQGCITFKTAHRFIRATALIQGHLVRPKVIEQARNYCMKDGKFVVVDNRKAVKRSDLDEIADFIAAGNDVTATARAFPVSYIKYGGGIRHLTHAFQNNAPRVTRPHVSWYYGASGTGKTYGAFKREPDLWITGDELTYFNGYTNQ